MITGSPRMINSINTDHRKLYINDKPLDRVIQYEYLGVKIDQHLSFDKALLSLLSRVGHKIYLLGMLRKYISQQASIRIFKALAMPYMEYAFFLLSACQDKHVTKLQRLQNKGMRICLRSRGHTSTASLHQDCKMLTVRNKIKLKMLKCMNRRINRPNCRDRAIGQRSTRSHDAPLFNEYFPLNSKFQKSLCGLGYLLWNRLEAEVRSIQDYHIFGARLKTIVIQEQLSADLL